jgi:hypothetical protein
LTSKLLLKSESASLIEFIVADWPMDRDADN